MPDHEYVRKARVLTRPAIIEDLHMKSEVDDAVEDIVRQRSEEQTRQRQQAELRALFDLIPAMIWVKDTENNIVRANRLGAENAGRSVEEIEGRSCREIYPRDADRFNAEDQEVIRSGLPKLGHVEAMPAAEGKRWMQTDKVPYRDEHGKVVGLVVMARDVTEPRLAALALSESKHFLKSTLDALSSHIAILDEHGTIIEVNAAWNRFAEQNGAGQGSCGLGDNYLEVCDTACGPFSDEAQGVAGAIRAITAGGRQEFYLEYPCDGPHEERWFALRATRFGGEKPWRVVIAHENITERKQAERALRKSEARFADAFAYAPIGMALVGGDGQWFKVNRALCELLGYSEAALLSLDSPELTYEEDKELTRETVRRLTAGESHSEQIEKRYLHSRGHLVTTSVSYTVIRDTAERATHYIAQIQDITARIQAEYELQQLLGSTAQHERMLMTMLSSFNDFAYIYDREGRFLFVNQPLLDLWGIPLESALGKNFFDLGYPAELAEKLHEQVQQVFRTKLSVTDETPYVSPAGVPGFYEYIFSPALGSDGTVEFVVGSTRDITSRKITEAALNKSEAKYRLLFENMLEGFAYCRLLYDDGRPIDFVFLEVNHAFERLTGLQNAVMKKVSDLLPGAYEADPGIFDMYGRVASTGNPERREAHLQPLGIWLSIAAYSGEAGHFAAVFDNITERKNAEAELARTNQRLVDTSRQAGMAEIATNVLHNVGNVLNSVNVSAGLAMESVKTSRAPSMARAVALLRAHEHDLGDYLSADASGRHMPAFLEELSSGWLAEQEALVKELELLRGNIDHIKEIVAMQQNYARVSDSFESLNVIDLVEDSLRMNEGALVRHQVQIVREFEDVPLLRVDRHKVLQILVNLISNAKIACATPGPVAKCITLRIAQVNDRIKISVTDNGVGIAPENLTLIFAHGFTTRRDGHGFGLHSGAIAATELGGCLRAYSDGPGKGATFTLELPIDSSGSSS